MGPLLTSYTLKDYFLNPILYQFVSSCALIHIHFLLPGVFEHSVMGSSSVNSSLWSVALELKLYVGLLVGWALRIPGKRFLLILLIIVLILGGYFFFNTIEDLLSKTTEPLFQFLHIHYIYTPLFLTGVLCTLYKKKIIIRNYWLFLIIPAFLASFYFNCYNITSFVLLPALVLYVAVTGVGFLKKITPNADFSYGIYVFAFPLQQIISNYLHPANPSVMFLLSVVAVLPFAMLSWYGLEKKALRAKRLVK